MEKSLKEIKMAVISVTAWQTLRASELAGRR